MNIRRFIYAFALVVIVQCGVYYYIDRIVLAPTESFHIGDGKQQTLNLAENNDGKVFYSYDKRYAAKVEDDKITVYDSNDKNKKAEQVDLAGAKVSFFEWLPDRNLAILATYGQDPATRKYGVYIRQYNPLMPDHKTAAQLKDVPDNSKIVDAAYSTATNVIYMKLKVGEDRYRIYRTDANYDTRRIYVQAENIGKIAVFPDKDIFLYDNLKSGTVYMLNGTSGGWRVISPTGKFRLIGAENENIFIAKYDGNDSNLVIAAYRGQLGIGFHKIMAYEKPADFSDVTMDSVRNM
ncbi:hypothetical protein [Pectinatus frisingensis]|uniref:hypothetical protein n=1 Tax=Pectinatus frisingensis TaxID=865 RepID=UPI0015F36031|nr:hypothetical protein [Pectinatus frisingensis]